MNTHDVDKQRAAPRRRFLSRNDWSTVQEQIPTATVADACVRLNADFQVAPIEIRPVVASSWCSGRVLPVQHRGSVDVFLAALDGARAGDILVIDNEGRRDEGCIGDLVVLEAAAAGVGGIIVWGCHRDTWHLMAIDLPVFSLGAYAVGPRRPNASIVGQPQPIYVGSAVVNSGDVVFADDDGVLFLSPEHLDQVLVAARDIQRVEQAQADALASGQPLRQQLRFEAYLALRRQDPTYAFREHVRQMNGAVEV